MADYTYPATLPKPLQNGFSRTEGAYYDSVQPASGTPFITIRSDDSPMSFSVQFEFSPAEMEEFNDWLKADDYAVLTGEPFNIGLLTDGGLVVQEAIFAPDGVPQLTSVRGEHYTVNAVIIARTFTENILPGAFNTPKNDFAYYFYSKYQYPDSLPEPLADGYSKSTVGRFAINSLRSGAYANKIVTDDTPTVYSLQFRFDATEAAIFRAWLAQDSFNMLKGAAFNMPLYTEYGRLLQVVRFADGGQPQITSTTADIVVYSAQVIARTQMDDVNGLPDAVFAPQVFATLLYPYLGNRDAISSQQAVFESTLRTIVAFIDNSDDINGVQAVYASELLSTAELYTFEDELSSSQAVFFSGVISVVKEYDYNENISASQSVFESQLTTVGIPYDADDTISGNQQVYFSGLIT